jgi:cytochrome b561
VCHGPSSRSRGRCALTPVTLPAPPPSIDANRRRWSIALQVTLGVMVVFIGVLGTLEHSGIRRVVAAWINIHALFGSLLVASVGARLRWCLKSRRSAGAAELRELNRHLSRIVYLILYLVIGARFVVNIVNHFFLAESACRSLACMLIPPMGDSRAILAYGLGVLIAIRVFIFWLFRSRQR